MLITDKPLSLDTPWTYFMYSGATLTIFGTPETSVEDLSKWVRENRPSNHLGSGEWKQGLPEIGYYDHQQQLWQWTPEIDEQVFVCGNKLILQFASTTYHNLGKVDYIELFFAEKTQTEDGEGYAVHQPQYFHRSDMKKACQAFHNRKVKTNAHRAGPEGDTLEEISQRIRSLKRNHKAVKVEELIPGPKNQTIEPVGGTRYRDWKISSDQNSTVFLFENHVNGRNFRLDFTEANKDLN